MEEKVEQLHQSGSLLWLQKMHSYKDCNCSCLHFCIYRCNMPEKTIKAVICNLALSLWENSELTFGGYT